MLKLFRAYRTSKNSFMCILAFKRQWAKEFYSNEPYHLRWMYT